MKYLNYEYVNNNLYDTDGKEESDEECFNGIPQLRIGSKQTFKGRVTRYMSSYFPYYNNNLVANDEIVFQYASGLNKYKGKKILIVGGGPTTNQCQWQNLDFDYVWSCNYFYQHPILKKIGTNLAFIGQEVDLRDGEFLNHCINNNTHVVFEPSGRITTTGGGLNINKIVDIPDSHHMCCFTRYYGWIGANWRQMILALFLGVKEIYFVGMDGYSFKTNPKNIPHSFQPGKEPKGGPMKPGAEEAFKQHLIIFWNYVLNELKPETKFYNLGEFSEDNMSRHISKKYFPLTDEIKKTIGV